MKQYIYGKDNPYTTVVVEVVTTENKMKKYEPHKDNPYYDKSSKQEFNNDK